MATPGGKEKKHTLHPCLLHVFSLEVLLYLLKFQQPFLLRLLILSFSLFVLLHSADLSSYTELMSHRLGP